jgi:hypothetical protein
MTQCKSCHAEIEWGITAKNNKRVPLDGKSEQRFVQVGAVDGVPVVELRRAYVSHFATCPNAAEHRKTA